MESNVKKPKTVAWIFMFAGLLWIAVVLVGRRMNVAFLGVGVTFLILGLVLWKKQSS